MTCTCGRVYLGLKVTDSLNWNPDCEVHGTQSDWYLSPEQESKRAVHDAYLIELYAKVNAMNKARKDAYGV